jgi:hypothetical protein
MFRMRRREQPHKAGHGDRAPAVACLPPRDGPAVAFEEAVRARGDGRHGLPVIGVDGFRLRRPVQQVAAATDAGGLRFDQPEHQHACDRRVDGRSALFQDVVSGARRVRVGRRDHEGLRVHRLFVDTAAVRLGRGLGNGGLRHRAGRHHQRGEAGAAAVSYPAEKVHAASFCRRAVARHGRRAPLGYNLSA